MQYMSQKRVPIKEEATHQVFQNFEKSCKISTTECIPDPFFSFFFSLWPLFLWMGFNCGKATEPLRGDSLLLITRSREVPGNHLIDLERMKD